MSINTSSAQASVTSSADFSGTPEAAAKWLQLDNWTAAEKRHTPDIAPSRKFAVAMRIRVFLEHFCADVTNAAWLESRHARQQKQYDGQRTGHYLQRADLIVNIKQDADTANLRRAMHVDVTVNDEDPSSHNRQATYNPELFMVLVKVDPQWNRLLGCYVYRYGEVAIREKLAAQAWTKEGPPAGAFAYIDFTKDGWHDLLLQQLTDKLMTALVYKPPTSGKWLEMTAERKADRCRSESTAMVCKAPQTYRVVKQALN